MLPRVETWFSAALGFGSLVALSVGGHLVAQAAHVPVPGPVVGLVVLVIALGILGRVPRGLRVASELLIRHLNLFYIPAAVGVTAYAGLLRTDLVAILIALVPGTWIALGAVALAFRSSVAGDGEP